VCHSEAASEATCSAQAARTAPVASLTVIREVAQGQPRQPASSTNTHLLGTEVQRFGV
jgi:hypothetical protein